MQILQSNKANFNQNRIVTSQASALSEGQIRISVERFAFTANNITYAVMGDRLKYWEFFPAVNDDGSDASKDWGIIPVWGFAVVTESKCDDVATGERFFGYFPPATDCLMTPANVTRGSFIDGSEHRAELPAPYNIYRSAPSEAANEQMDKERMMLFPLYLTAYCIHDLLASKNWLDAEQVIVISASSKTSIGVAYAVQGDPQAPKSIGLTSSRNLAAVNGLGLYDSVSTYEQVLELDSGKSTVIVDMSGNTQLLSELHQHFGDNMLFTLNVGLTHWASFGEASGVNTERSHFFFAPGHIQEMMKRMGPQEFQTQSGKFVEESAARSRDWLKFEMLDGLTALQQDYAAVCEGTISADTGLIVVL